MNNFIGFKLHPYIKIALMYLLVSVGLVVTIYILKSRDPDYYYSFLSYYDTFASKWDVSHYLSIAENWYAASGNDALLIVFFPFYPICIRILHTITTLDYRICASIISLVCGFFSTIMLYKLVLLDFNKKTAYYCTKFYLLYPFIFFIFTKMSEGLYMLLLFSTIYNLRKKRYLLSGVLGYMLALTRLPGLAVGVIMLTETIIPLVKDLKEKKFLFINYYKQILMMLMTLYGFCTYLLINYYIHGNPFQFLIYQKSNWQQTFRGPLFAFKTAIEQITRNYDLEFKIGVGVGNIIAMVIVLAAVGYALYKFRVSYAIYTFVYFIVCYSPSWLLSGPRYSLGAFTIFMALGILARKYKILNALMTILFPLIMIAFCMLYIPGYMY